MFPYEWARDLRDRGRWIAAVLPWVYSERIDELSICVDDIRLQTYAQATAIAGQ